MPSRPALSIVVPVYQCAECLQPLTMRLAAVCGDLGLADYEIVLVDDRSRDTSWAVVSALAAGDSRIEAVRLSRNFGQHAAITAGLARARGERVVVMDCDLQDPPEVIPALYAAALAGSDVVLAKRRRSGQPVRGLLSRAYFKLTNALLGTDIDGAYGNFSCISRKVVDAFLRVRDQDRRYLNILLWLGFTQTSIEYDHRPRFAGKSSYTLGGLLRHGYEGLFFHTTTLLRWIVYVGFGVAACGALLAAYLVAKYLGEARPPEGWTSLAVLTLIIGGFIIVSTGVTGLYIGMIFKQVKDRPLYLVDESVTHHADEAGR